jgi:hypothetical protein
MYDCLLDVTARTVPDGAWRTEVVDVARHSSSRDGPVGRVRELTGVAVFGLRLRAVQATAGRAVTAWRQGAALGSMLLLGAALAKVTAQLIGGGEAIGWTAVAGALIVAALATVAAGRPAPAALVTAAALIATLLTPGPDRWTPVVAALGVALVALVFAAAGEREVAGSGHRWLGPTVVVPGRRWWVGLLVLACGPVVLGGGTAAVGAIAVATTLVVPAVLVAVGGADARLAVAAVVTWSWRFLAVDPTDVLDALRALGSSELHAILVRLGLMAWGVGLAVVVAHRSARRAAAL